MSKQSPRSDGVLGCAMARPTGAEHPHENSWFGLRRWTRILLGRRVFYVVGFHFSFSGEPLRFLLSLGVLVFLLCVAGPGFLGVCVFGSLELSALLECAWSSWRCRVREWLNSRKFFCFLVN